MKNLYWVWSAMIQRCKNPNSKFYKNYGARGISVSKEWESFNKFFEDMGLPPKGMTLERKDNNLGYSKENCCWADRATQALNRRVFATNKIGISGIEIRSYGAYRVRARRNKKIVLDVTVSNLFDACCIKKSFENRKGK